LANFWEESTLYQYKYSDKIYDNELCFIVDELYNEIEEIDE